jgi:hypothetical protein
MGSAGTRLESRRLESSQRVCPAIWPAPSRNRARKRPFFCTSLPRYVRPPNPHALLSKLPGQPPHRRGVCVGLVGPLPGRAVGEEDHGADHLIAPLDLIHKLQLQLREVIRLHSYAPRPQEPKTGDL